MISAFSFSASSARPPFSKLSIESCRCFTCLRITAIASASLSSPSAPIFSMVAFLRAALSNRRTLRRAASLARIASFKSSSIRFCNDISRGYRCETRAQLPWRKQRRKSPGRTERSPVFPSGERENRRRNSTDYVAAVFPGSAHVSRVGFGVSPKQSFSAKVRDREDAIANTRDACATRNGFRRQAADECRQVGCAPQSRLKAAQPFCATPCRLDVAHGNRFYILVRALQ